MTKVTGLRLNIFSETALTEEGGVRIDASGVIYYHNGSIEQVVLDPTNPADSLTSPEVAGVQGSTTPITGANPVASAADIGTGALKSLTGSMRIWLSNHSCMTGL